MFALTQLTAGLTVPPARAPRGAAPGTSRPLSHTAPERALPKPPNRTSKRFLVNLCQQLVGTLPGSSSLPVAGGGSAPCAAGSAQCPLWHQPHVQEGAASGTPKTGAGASLSGAATRQGHHKGLLHTGLGAEGLWDAPVLVPGAEGCHKDPWLLAHHFSSASCLQTKPMAQPVLSLRGFIYEMTQLRGSCDISESLTQPLMPLAVSQGNA